MVDLIIFDVDGTLVDSETKCLLALTKVIPELQMTPAELSQAFRGRKLDTIFREIEQSLDIRLPGSITDDYRAAYVTLVQDGLSAFPYVRETLRALQPRACVASNAPPAKIGMNLVAAGLDTFFPAAARFSAYDVQAWKPDPRLFETAAAAYSVDARSCVVIEDSAAGIAAAERAGMAVIQYCEPGADQLCELTFTDYRDLPLLLDRL